MKQHSGRRSGQLLQGEIERLVRIEHSQNWYGISFDLISKEDNPGTHRLALTEDDLLTYRLALTESP